MTKKTHNDEQLKISQFIKEPASLKLLILAGTNIRPTELPTIAKCTGLIKLDLSNNFLGDLPIKFSTFPQLKILYLHDNQIMKIQITKTALQYISLFSNPIHWHQYRLQLIHSNKNLLAIDKNVVSQKQRVYAQNRKEYSDEIQKYNSQQLMLPLYAQLKWPIVQISASLEHEDDYLNLLKAQIFVINNVAKRTNKIQYIQNIFKGVLEQQKFKIIQKNGGLEGGANQRRWLCALKAAKKWKQYTLLRRKLRKILASKGKEDLMMNKMELKKKNRNPGISLVMEAFLPLVRKKMNARGTFERNIYSFRKYIPTKKMLYEHYLNFSKNRSLLDSPVKFYFRDSQYEILSKITLYAKKLLFQQKEYDLCDDFSELFKETGTKYYIFRAKQPYEEQRSWLLNSIHETTGLVLKKCGVDRTHFNYNKKGHKKITVKSLSKKIDPDLYYDRLLACDRKIDYLEQKYDRIVQYNVKDHKILNLLLKIIRYINAGNSSTVVLTETAYFQTEVNFDSNEDKKQERVKFFLGLEFFMKRVIAANVIQRFWRKKLAQKNCQIKIIKAINENRAQNLLCKWQSNLIFQHRVMATQTNSYYLSTWKRSQVYLHLDIYMNLPQPTNFLRYPQSLSSKNELYNIFHHKTQIQIVEAVGRKWIKVCFSTPKRTAEAQQKLFKNTYRYYYNGFYIKFFTNQEIKQQNLLTLYEQRVQKMYDISIQKTQIQQKNSILWVDNVNPYFIWSEMQLETTRKIFADYDKKSTNVSIFIYNKHKRPLKVSCQIYWVQPESIYLRERRVKSVSHTGILMNSQLKNLQNSLALRVKDKKKEMNLEQSMKKQYQVDMPLRRSRNRQVSLKSSSKKSNSLMRSHRTRIVSDPRLQLLSQTLNIKRK